MRQVDLLSKPFAVKEWNQIEIGGENRKENNPLHGVSFIGLLAPEK